MSVDGAMLKLSNVVMEVKQKLSDEDFEKFLTRAHDLISKHYAD